ncbi:MAG: heparinase II/III family protein [Lachnospiraceae bacterium]|nr:heparinase II/III family protein [Lachnospiraceae bacterium]
MNNTELRNQIDRAACELRDKDMPELTDELFGLFEKNGNRLEYENVYFPRRRFLAVYGIKAILSGKQEDIRKLEQVIKEICKEKTWALPAHCDRKKRPDVEKEIDLFNSETAGALSEIVENLGDLLDPAVRSLVKEEVGRRCLIPFASSDQRYGFEHALHNWNAVCCGSLGVALMNLGEEIIGKEKTAEALSRINSSLLTFVDSFPGDGACLEGAGYFNYGVSFLMAYARRYREWAGDDPDAVKDPKIKKIAGFPNAAFFSNGMAVNFSDSGIHEKLHAGTLQALQEICGTDYSFGEEILQDFDSDPCYRFLPLLDDVRHGGELELGGKSLKKRLTVLSDSEWVISENGKGQYFAVKGGNNGEPHNHNDVGSYIYIDGNDVIACELGAGEYTADYFGAGRYGILCNGTQGHSLPMIGGKGQLVGKEARAKDFRHEEKEGILTVSMDLTDCYENAEKVMRTLEFNEISGELTVRDEILTDKDVTDRIVSKKNIGNNIEILSKNTITEIHNEIFRNHEGTEEKIFIFELKEEKNEGNQEGDHRKGLHSYTYRLHP